MYCLYWLAKVNWSEDGNFPGLACDLGVQISYPVKVHLGYPERAVEGQKPSQGIIHIGYPTLLPRA